MPTRIRIRIFFHIHRKPNVFGKILAHAGHAQAPRGTPQTPYLKLGHGGTRRFPIDLQCRVWPAILEGHSIRGKAGNMPDWFPALSMAISINGPQRAMRAHSPRRRAFAHGPITTIRPKTIRSP
ncbi:hypothetical protein [Solilutibacter pythonis]|uniref:hypothetical protein n=1 Tax=Solilutibacter pythonis TaxID=2483112 RepID=UPI001313D8CF|nr:hypothetical protein [Lysobacter pythonis]